MIRKKTILLIILLLFIISSIIQIINFRNNYILINKTNGKSNQAIIHENDYSDNTKASSAFKPKEKENGNNNNVNEDENKNEISNAITDYLLASFHGPINLLEEFSELTSRIELHTTLWNIIFRKNESENENENEKKNKNETETENDFKAYKNELIHHSQFLVQENRNDLPNEKKLLAGLHQELYPWLYNHRFHSMRDIMQSSNGKGLVLCTGDLHFKFARSTIDTLRNVIHTSLPIEIFYNGEEDLSESNREILREYQDVYVTDISSYFDNSIIEISGWAIKPFAILASRFEEVILIDADVVYLRDPIELFEDQGYSEKGTLFFRDRTLFPGSNPGLDWLKSWMVHPLPETKTLRFWNEASMHEMESSTVVIHKTRNLLGLLSTCKLNERQIRDDVVYQYVYGDKETFWIGFDIARQHYNLNPLPCIYVGKYYANDDTNNKGICGHIGHTLSNGNFMFWNGHIVKDKSNITGKESLIDFDSFVVTNDNNEWAEDLTCLILDNVETKPIPLDNYVRQTIDKILQRENLYHYVIQE